MTKWIDELEAEVLKTTIAKVYPDPIALAYALDPDYRVRAHLAYLSDRLVQAIRDVEAGISRNIAISMPPRMGKSTLVSVYLILWILNQHPTWKIGLVSHAPTLAASWGRQVRRMVEQHPELGVKVAKDAGAVTEWETTKKGSVVSRSIGQTVTGLGFKVLVMDDVVKDFATAHSETSRESVWDWWTFNSRTRLEPPTLVIAIGTRWHEDDYIGRLLSPEHEGDPSKWEVISFPAVAKDQDVLGREEGEPLISPLQDETLAEALVRWNEIKDDVGSYAWAALYQQEPSPAKGAIFESDWWSYYEPHEIENLVFDKIITSWDCAFKDTKTSDYVVGQKWGAIGADRYLLDQVRGRWSFTETLVRMRRFCVGVSEHVVEDKANGTAVIDVLKREISGMIPVNPTNSKEARARAVTPQIESRNVKLPKWAPWLSEYLLEHQSFPNAPHDDQVDCTTQALTRLGRGAGPPQVAEVRGMLGGW